MKKNLLIIAASGLAFLPSLLVLASEGPFLVRAALLAYGVALAMVAKRTGWAKRLDDALAAVFPDTAISE